jgi:hypothetical protein
LVRECIGRGRWLILMRLRLSWRIKLRGIGWGFANYLNGGVLMGWVGG